MLSSDTSKAQLEEREDDFVPVLSSGSFMAMSLHTAHLSGIGYARALEISMRSARVVGKVTKDSGAPKKNEDSFQPDTKIFSILGLWRRGKTNVDVREYFQKVKLDRQEGKMELCTMQQRET